MGAAAIAAKGIPGVSQGHSLPLVKELHHCLETGQRPSPVLLAILHNDLRKLGERLEAELGAYTWEDCWSVLKHMINHVPTGALDKARKKHKL